MKILGKDVLRKEGVAKISGQAKYIDDLPFKDLLHGITIRSSIPRGEIQSIDFLDGVPWKEFTIVTYKDIPGKNAVAIPGKGVLDQPFLIERMVNHPEEPVLLLAHPNKDLLLRARSLVSIQYTSKHPVFTIEESRARETIIWGKDNTFKTILIEKGDIESALSSDATVVEGTYRTGAQEQLYIEPNGVVASASSTEGVTVWGSMQCPYYVQHALKTLFGLPDEKIRIIQTETGGGFGGKEEYPSIIAGHAALLALRSGKTVKMIYYRTEDMLATTKRHPSLTRIRTAVDSKGKLLAIDIDFALDGGAYMTLSPVVLSRGAIHAAGPYACDNVRVSAQAFATNAPPHGAFRGFGAPQSIFAMERHIDKVATALKLSPAELRRRNLVQKGQTLATGQVVREQIPWKNIFDKALSEVKFNQKFNSYPKANGNSHIKHGVGIATFFHGAGFTGGGEKALGSIAAVDVLPTGQVRVLTSNTEIGQGTNTIFSQIVAEALGIPYDSVVVAQPDTHLVPNSGPTVASRTCMIVGKLVQNSALGVRETLQKVGLLTKKYTPKQFQSACKNYLKKYGPLRVETLYEQPQHITWDDQTYRGDAYGTFAWATYVADVAVDTVTYQVDLKQFIAVQEVGKVVHPTLARGQIIGGVVQGIGYALYEGVTWKEGRMANPKMTNYIVPTSADAPDMKVFFVENPYVHGPFGAKGIGELPMDGPAPAILNAVENALGTCPNEIPMLPEMLLAHMEDLGG